MNLTLTAPTTPDDVEKYPVTEWQEEDLNSLTPRDYSANWSEMGTFKTSTLLRILERKLHFLVAPKVLVVTTRTGKGTYFQVAPEILKDWTILNVNATSIEWEFAGELWKWEGEVPLHNKKPLLVVAHYHCFTNKSKDKFNLEKHKWDFIALDEAHRIKERNTQWTRNLKKLRKNTKFRHVMTGTGFINRPSEIWSLLNFLDGRRWSSKEGFCRYFCQYEEDDAGYVKEVGVQPEKLQEFREMVRELGPRRTMAEVFPDMDKPIFTKVLVDLNPTQRKMYDEIKYQLMTLDKNGYPIHSPNVLSLLNRCRQISVATPEVIGDRYDPKLERRVIDIKLREPSSKLDALMEIIEGLEWDDERHDQIVVFSNFKDPLELLKARLDKASIPYIHMEEKDSDTTRYNKWGIEWPKKKHQVFMSTLQLGSESISLVSAQRLVFLDRSWSPKDNSQGVSRIYRPGQTLIPQIINIESRNTVDSRILKTNIQKQGWFTQVFGEEIVWKGN